MPVKESCLTLLSSIWILSGFVQARLRAVTLVFQCLLAAIVERDIHFELHHPSSETELPRTLCWRVLGKAAGV